MRVVSSAVVAEDALNPRPKPSRAANPKIRTPRAQAGLVPAPFAPTPESPTRQLPDGGDLEGELPVDLLHERQRQVWSASQKSASSHAGILQHHQLALACIQLCISFANTMAVTNCHERYSLVGMACHASH